MVGAQKNLGAALASTMWTAATAIFVIPFYIKYLGVETYGLVGFFLTLQAIFQLLDVGLSAAINREVAKSISLVEKRALGQTLHSLAVVYWFMAAGLFGVLFILSASIASDWLSFEDLSTDSVETAVILMGAVIAFRLPIALYQGALIGAQKLVTTSVLSILMITLGNFGALLLLVFVSDTIVTFFLWQLLTSFVYVFSIRSIAWKEIGRLKSDRFSVDSLKKNWRFTLHMAAVSWIAILFTQMDKVILSNILGLADYAHYMLAVTVVGVLYMFVTPTYNFLYPKFTALVAGDNVNELFDLYTLSIRLLAVFIFPLAMVLVVSSGTLVEIWTGRQDLSLVVGSIVSVMVIGTALHCVMYIPHALQLANGMSRLPLIINLTVLVMFVPTIVILTSVLGALGAAFAWVILHLCYMVLSVSLTQYYILKGRGLTWFYKDMGVPLMVSIFGGAAYKYTLTLFDLTGYSEVFFAAISASALILVGIVSSKTLRSYACQYVKSGALLNQN